MTRWVPPSHASRLPCLLPGAPLPCLPPTLPPAGRSLWPCLPPALPSLRPCRPCFCSLSWRHCWNADVCLGPALPSPTCSSPLTTLQGSSQGHWRFPGHAVEQGYAYILTHPGTPCVFWDHLCDQRAKDMVARLVAVRKRAGIHCRSEVRTAWGQSGRLSLGGVGGNGLLLRRRCGTSELGRAGAALACACLSQCFGLGSQPRLTCPHRTPSPLQVKILKADRDVYAAEIEGRHSKLLMKIGPGDFHPGGSSWSIADCGHNWGVWEAPKPAAPKAAAPAAAAAQ